MKYSNANVEVLNFIVEVPNANVDVQNPNPGALSLDRKKHTAPREVPSRFGRPCPRWRLEFS